MFSALLSSEKYLVTMNVVDILNYNIGFRFRFSICLYFGGSLIEVIIEIISIVNIRLSTFWSRFTWPLLFPEGKEEHHHAVAARN